MNQYKVDNEKVKEQINSLKAQHPVQKYKNSDINEKVGFLINCFLTVRHTGGCLITPGQKNVDLTE